MCSGFGGCESSTVIGPYGIVASGTQAARSNIIYNVSFAYGFGHESLQYSSISNRINKNLTVYFTGSKSGFSTNVYCYGNKTTFCNVYCTQRGCDDNTNCVANGESQCLFFEFGTFVKITAFFFLLFFFFRLVEFYFCYFFIFFEFLILF